MSSTRSRRPADNPLLALDKRHHPRRISLCWTDECFRRIAEDAFTSVVAVGARHGAGQCRQSRPCSTIPASPPRSPRVRKIVSGGQK